jgi:branched-chain amino acid transport system substrate-binding protein
MKFFKTSLLSLALAASFSAVQAQELKIGLMSTLSGPGAALGNDQADAFMLAVEQLGGKMAGRTVTVIKEDDQLKPEVGAQLAQKFLQKDKVDLVTGVIFSNVMMAVHKPITDSGTFFIGSNAGPSPITGKGCSPFYFSTSWNNDQLHEAGASVANLRGYKNVYVLAPNYQAGKDAVSGFKRVFKGKIADEVYTAVNQPDYSVEIAAIQAAKPDAIYTFYPGGMGVNFVKQYRQAGLFGKIPMVSAATVDGSTLPALKDQALGAQTGTPYSPDLDNSQNKQFVAYFKKKYFREPSLYAAQSYDAAMLINSALVKTKGSLADKDAFRKAMRAADFKSVRGNFKFNTNHFPITNFFQVDVVKDGSGIASFKTMGVVMKDAKDVYANQCAMK